MAKCLACLQSCWVRASIGISRVLQKFLQFSFDVWTCLMFWCFLLLLLGFFWYVFNYMKQLNQAGQAVQAEWLAYPAPSMSQEIRIMTECPSDRQNIWVGTSVNNTTANLKLIKLFIFPFKQCYINPWSFLLEYSIGSKIFVDSSEIWHCFIGCRYIEHQRK